MMNFKSPNLADYKDFSPFFFDEGEISCEANFISIYVWKQIYGNEFHMDDKTLVLRSISDDENKYVFSLPYGDLDHGMSLIFEYCKAHNIKPNLWTSQGKRFDCFIKKYDSYEIIPQRDNFDYIYNREDLVELKGKKYHSKRNHISSFSKKYDWSYETLDEKNKAEFLAFSEKWYNDRKENNEGLYAEKEAFAEILSSANDIDYKGGLIRVGDRIAAITIGSPINSYTYDIHYENADIDFPTAYTVVNREFAARELQGYKYINREDDLGIEGLRKAKMSYKPEMLLEKYSMIYSGDEF